MFGRVLRLVTRAGLLQGKMIGINATTLEANTAMKSTVRTDTEESYTERGMKRRCRAWTGGGRRRQGMGSGPTRTIRKRRSPAYKDGLAYKAEHAEEMDTGAIVAVTTHGGAVGDTSSVGETRRAAGEAAAEQIAEQTSDGKFTVNAKGVESG